MDTDIEKLMDRPLVETGAGGSGMGSGGKGMGVGKGPGTGMGGTGEGEVRFIRLEHNGDWDNNLTENPGFNLMREFSIRTGIPPVPRKSTTPSAS